LVSKKGLYDGWVLLIDTAVSVYLAVMLSPTLIDAFSINPEKTSVIAFIIIATALISFGILYALAYILFLGQFEVKFPKIVDMSGAALTGFAAGLLAWSFIIFVLVASPMGKSKTIEKMKLDQKRSFNFMYTATKPLSAMAAKKDCPNSFERNIDSLLEGTRQEIAKRNAPKKKKVAKKPVEEVVVEAKPTVADLGDPPNLDFEDL